MKEKDLLDLRYKKYEGETYDVLFLIKMFVSIPVIV